MIHFDEPKAIVLVKPFHSTFCHILNPNSVDAKGAYKKS
jgi:hypothetical protein